MSLKAIIVDDERKARELLLILMKQYCPGIEVAALCTSVAEAKEQIEIHEPDLVFLDVEMEESGFHLVDSGSQPAFEVIFITAHGKYALDAFKINASGYLTKPVVPELLVKAVAKVTELVETRKENFVSHLLLEKTKKGNDRIGVPTLSGVNFIEIDTIIRCQASSNYTEIYLKTGEKIVVSRTLKEFEELLRQHNFLRVHKSHVVNLSCISTYQRSENASLTLLDGTILPVSLSMKAELEKQLNII